MIAKQKLFTMTEQNVEYFAEELAREKWNEEADQYNQWEVLDDEEKRLLIQKEIEEYKK